MIRQPTTQLLESLADFTGFPRFATLSGEDCGKAWSNGRCGDGLWYVGDGNGRGKGDSEPDRWEYLGGAKVTNKRQPADNCDSPIPLW